jgi:hypothetical protein
LVAGAKRGRIPTAVFGRATKQAVERTAARRPALLLTLCMITMGAMKTFLPCFDDLPDGFLQTDRDIPCRVVPAHLAQITDVANVIADAVLFNVA